MFTRITNQLHLFRDTCNVYVLACGREAVLVDFGSGDVLDHLIEIGLDRVTDVLVTHHHRDQRLSGKLRRRSRFIPKILDDHSISLHACKQYTS